MSRPHVWQSSRLAKLITTIFPWEAWAQAGLGEPVSVASAAVAARAVVATAESAAGASVRSVAYSPRWHFVARVAGALCPAAVAASAVLVPAFAGAFAAVAGISDPSSRCPCSGEQAVPSGEDPSDDRQERAGRRSQFAPEPPLDWQEGYTELQPVA